VWTSTGDYCLGGITRANVLQVCREAGIPAFERNFTVAQVYSADEAFVTGTYAGLVPVRALDGRRIGDDTFSPRPTGMVPRLQALYRDLVARDVAARRASRSAS